MAGQRATRPLPLSWRMFMLSFIKEILHRQLRRVLWCPCPHEAKLLAWESLDPVQKKKTRPYTPSHALNLSAPCCSETLNSVRLSACSSYTHHTLDLELPEPLMVSLLLFGARHGGIVRPGLWKLESFWPSYYVAGQFDPFPFLNCQKYWNTVKVLLVLPDVLLFVIVWFLVICTEILTIHEPNTKARKREVRRALGVRRVSRSLICTRYILPDVHLSVLTHQPWINWAHLSITQSQP